MEALETKNFSNNGKNYRASIYTDPEPLDPLADYEDMGAILSLNRRHANFNPQGVEAAFASNPDVIPLAYFEHGQCLWSVANELPEACRCRWDSVSLAGVWIPDQATLEEAKQLGGRTRHHFMKKRARQACASYTRYCNGEIYGYVVERVTVCDHCGVESAAMVDSCWGIDDMDECKASISQFIDGDD